MNEQEIRQKLAANGLESYIQVFEKEHLLDADVLSSMTDSDFASAGISAIGDRKRMMLLFSKASSSNNEPVKNKKGNPLKVIVAVLLAAAACGASFFLYSRNEMNKYYEKMAATHSRIMSGAVEAEECIELVHSVWYDKVYNRYSAKTDKYTRDTRDFNAALSKLYKDQQYVARIAKINGTSSDIDKLMKEITPPPAALKDAHATLKECYEEYVKLAGMARTPSGSLTSFSQDFKALDSSIMVKLKSFETNLK